MRTAATSLLSIIRLCSLRRGPMPRAGGRRRRWQQQQQLLQQPGRQPCLHQGRPPRWSRWWWWCPRLRRSLRLVLIRGLGSSLSSQCRLGGFREQNRVLPAGINADLCSALCTPFPSTLLLRRGGCYQGQSLTHHRLRSRIALPTLPCRQVVPEPEHSRLLLPVTETSLKFHPHHQLR